MDLISKLFLVVMVDTDDGRWTTPGHKLPTGELKILLLLTENLTFSFLLLRHSASVPSMAVLEKGVHYKGNVPGVLGILK